MLNLSVQQLQKVEGIYSHAKKCLFAVSLPYSLLVDMLHAVNCTQVKSDERYTLLHNKVTLSYILKKKKHYIFPKA